MTTKHEHHVVLRGAASDLAQALARLVNAIVAKVQP